jgi:uncharacterized 2Fe-2S/4Fe-4S cluster protein (DUF4445 family)
MGLTAASKTAEAQVEFPEQQRRASVTVGRTLLDAVHAARLEVSNVCAGRGVCGKCRVVVTSGSEFLSPATDLERMSLSDADIQQGFRIACCARITAPGPLSIQIPPESLTEAQQLLVAGTQPNVELNPILEKQFLTLPQASLTDFRPDLERLIEVLETRSKLPRLRPSYAALKGLPEAMRKGQWNVTVTVTDDGLIIWIDAGRTDNRLYGFALDVGTTKLAGYLVDLRTGIILGKASLTNPQVAYGADVISRISYASKGQEELAELQRKVVEAANSLIQECCAQAKVEARDIFQVVIVGNTAMHHIFLGIPPKYVALAPYTAVLRSSFQTYARELGIVANPGCLLSALPCVAGFVGADAIADILATEMHRSPSIALLVDIGTNTEIVLGDHRRLVSCSSPSGPAFEGAQIKHGMRAEVGAIERVWIDPGTFEAGYSTIGGVKPRGLCGSAVIDAIASMRRTGIIDVNGRIGSSTGSKRIRSQNGPPEYVVAWKEETQTGRDIVITQHDIEEIKLAKAAVHSGIMILANQFNVQVKDITRIFIAGAFGTYVDPYSARTIGMYPDIPLGRISFVGNTAGSGARMALLSKQKCAEAQRIAEALEYVELAADPDFQEEFVNSLYIPHKYAAKLAE